MKYDFRNIDCKWQNEWKEKEAFKALNDYTLPKYYALIEFPYPSERGCTWHLAVYGSRYRRAQKAYAGL